MSKNPFRKGFDALSEGPKRNAQGDKLSPLSEHIRKIQSDKRERQSKFKIEPKKEFKKN